MSVLRAWLPNSRPALGWERLRPRTALHWVSCLVLWAIVGAYAGVWVNAHSGYLFDPLLQSDDARTSLEHIRLVPPPLAVTSLKRRWSGQLDDTDLIILLEAWSPEQIFLTGRRLPVTKALLEYLGPRYRLVHADPRGGGLLVRNDL